MQYSRWLFVPAVLAACMLLVAPLKADAASSGDASVKKVSASSKAASKKSASKDVRNAKRNVKKTSAQKQKTQRKNGKKQSRVTRESVDSRDVWLRRAQESEIMTGRPPGMAATFTAAPRPAGSTTTCTPSPQLTALCPWAP